MKKYLKLLAMVLLVVGIGVVVWLYLGFFGNPVSKLLMKSSAEKYVEANYPDCHVERWGYNFKNGDYFANIQCETSPDTNFFVYADWLGNIYYDSYESYVTSGHNTRNRMMMEYRALLDEAMPQESVDFTIDIFYGDILSGGSYEKYYYEKTDGNIVAMPDEEILLDKQYDYHYISYKYGYVCLHVTDEDVSVERACEILLEVKEILHSNNIGFYCIDFTLMKPRKADGMPSDDETRINIDYFLWDDIYEDGLADRVQSAHDRLTAYYAREDAKK